MVTVARGRVSLTVAVGLCLIGAVDAAIDSAWDQLALFLGAAALVVTTLLRQQPHRRVISLRADLVEWLHERSQIAGEPVEAAADRAVAAHRAGLTGQPDDEGR